MGAGCCFTISTVQSQTSIPTEIEQKVIQAIANISDAQRKDWAVHISHYENEEGDITSSIERYTPHENPSKRWTLLRINDQVPSDKQRKKFAKKKLERAENKDEGEGYSVNFNTLIVQDSLQLLSDNSSEVEVGFRVRLDEFGDDAQSKLQGTLLYSKQQDYIETITISNSDEFSPMFSASISELELSFNFIKLSDVVLPQKIEMQMKGSFAYFTEIDEISTTTYSDYQLKVKPTLK